LIPNISTCKIFYVFNKRNGGLSVYPHRAQIACLASMRCMVADTSHKKEVL